MAKNPEKQIKNISIEICKVLLIASIIIRVVNQQANFAVSCMAVFLYCIFQGLQNDGWHKYDLPKRLV